MGRTSKSALGLVFPRQPALEAAISHVGVGAMFQGAMLFLAKLLRSREKPGPCFGRREWGSISSGGKDPGERERVSRNGG